jgi:hypothetical protein
MEMESTRTVEGTGADRVRQFSVFLENKVGALCEIVKLLNRNHVEVVAFSVQDASDSSIVRLIVSDPDRVAQLFDEFGIPFQAVNLVVVELREASQLAAMLTCLVMAEVNIHFSYPLMVRPGGRAAIAMHVEDDDCTCAVLGSHSFNLLTQADISR